MGTDIPGILTGCKCLFSLYCFSLSPPVTQHKTFVHLIFSPSKGIKLDNISPCIVSSILTFEED